MEKQIAKPICVIYIPKGFSFAGNGVETKPLELMIQFNGWQRAVGGIGSRSLVPEYIWFCFFKEGITEPEIKTFYDKDITHIQYDELKEIITRAINQTAEAASS